MSDPLVFMMGEFEASFPTDRLYAKNHMWGQVTAKELDGPDAPERRIRFGFSAYAVRLLQDVYFLDWTVDEGVVLTERQEIGAIESKKAESDLFSPVAGRLIQFNQQLMSDPSAINVDKYGAGWLFEMQGDAGPLLLPEQYVQHLESVWEVTQRTIKGQLNQ